MNRCFSLKEILHDKRFDDFIMLHLRAGRLNFSIKNTIRSFLRFLSEFFDHGVDLLGSRSIIV